MSNHGVNQLSLFSGFPSVLMPRGSNASLRWPRAVILATLTFLIPCFQGLHAQSVLNYFVHLSWDSRSGAPAEIRAIAQTPDGYLWIGAMDGLYRFDGVRFEHWTIDLAPQEMNQAINSLFVARDGTLWISYRVGGIVALNAGANSYTVATDGTRLGSVLQFAQAEDGTIWAAGSSNLLKFSGSGWSTVGLTEGISPSLFRAVFFDSHGNLWVASDGPVYIRKLHETHFRRLQYQFHQVSQIAEAPDGQIWFAETTRSVYPISLDPIRVGKPEVRVGSRSLLFDNTGTLWVTSLGDGLRVLPGSEKATTGSDVSSILKAFTHSDGLTHDYLETVFEDREGTIWVGSLTGLDSFRRSSVGAVSTSTSVTSELVPTRSHDAWVIDREDIRHIVIGRSPSVTFAGRDTKVSRKATDPIWVPGFERIFLLQQGKFRSYSYPHIPLPVVGPVILVPREGGEVMMAEPQDGLFDLSGKSWAKIALPSSFDHELPTASYRDRSGMLWLAFRDGHVVQIQGTRVIRIIGRDALEVGSISGIGGDANRLWICSDRGLFSYENGNTKRVLPYNIGNFTKLTDVVEAGDEVLWLTGTHGVFRVSPEEWKKALDNPSHRVAYQTFTAADGLPMDYVRRVSAGPDGTVWFLCPNGVAWIPAEKRVRNTVVPPVAIQSVVSNKRSYSPAETIRLSPGNESLRITFTGLSLADPKRVLFRYMLQGVDTDWHDAGTLREATYSHLGPGEYTFRVKACNNDGIWNEDGASVKLLIPPLWYQTKIFLALCILTGAALVWVFYRLRLIRISNALHLRYEERSAERFRIARELHDTLLQTIQATTFLLGRASNSSESEERRHDAIQRSVQYLDNAVQESRNAIFAMRNQSADETSFVIALRNLLGQHAQEREMNVVVSTSGTNRLLKSNIEEDLLKIAYEATRNAIQHSQASSITIHVNYGRDFTIFVKDDGIGIPSELLAEGREGHFGIQGMHERAALRGGMLTIASDGSSGTTVSVTVPGRFSYEDWSPSIVRAILSSIGGMLRPKQK